MGIEGNRRERGAGVGGLAVDQELAGEHHSQAAVLRGKLERSLKSGEPLRVKQGFDPTRPDLHIGHAVSIRKLRDFQDLGHEVIFVVGDTTAMVGDPTGRSELRPQLSAGEVAANAATYADQVFKILDPARTRVEFNSGWLGSLKLEDMLRLTGQYTVARMLEREDFANRHRDGVPISLVEFMYPLLQAYDSVALRADVELGGSDQKFNLLVARAIQERYGQEPQVCLLMPLLRGTDGVHKMSKSYDNYVGLADAPVEQYGRTMSIPDTLLEEWFRLASGLGGEELASAVNAARSEPYLAKRKLASRIVQRYHGEVAASHAAEHFDVVHRQKGVPEDVEEVQLSPADPALAAEGGEVWLPRLLVRVGLAPSTSQASRLIEQGAVSLDGERVEGREARVPASGEHLLQKGRRHFVRAVFRGD
ncbi:MAG: tyrosine--tRNA ligase [Gemmatimonadetes bacterium]|nr:tyrosine--tRNA ligase [Gemmatimonadota bacterium]